MSFDLRIITISYDEPTLWVSVVLSALVAVLLGRRVGLWIGRIQDRWRRRVYGGLVTGATIVALLLLPDLLLYPLFSVKTGGAMVCPAFVSPALLVPALLGVGAEAIAWRSTRTQPAAWGCRRTTGIWTPPSREK